MKKQRIANKKRFATSVILAIIILGLIIFEAISIAGKIKESKQSDPFVNGEDPKVEEKKDEVPVLSQREIELAAAKEKNLSMERPTSLVEDFNLILVNKTHALSKDYWPQDLVVIERTVEGVGNKYTKQLRAVAAEALNKMLDAAQADGYTIKMRTGFRSYAYQDTLYNSYVTKHGQAEADTYSARPGMSEHQTGLVCDLGAKSNNFELGYNFGSTPEGQWIANHAHEYGFIIRFTDGTKDTVGKYTGYVAEPWHVRYVGVEHATAIHEAGITLEEYLGITD